MEKYNIYSNVNIIGYIVLVLFSILWLDIHHLSLWAILLTSLPLIAADIFSHYNVKWLAKIYTHRKFVAVTAFLVCTLCSFILYALFPFYTNYNDSGFFILATQFFFQGTVVGVVIRMLLLNLYANLIRAKSLHIAKLLIMIAWVVFIIMFPIADRHRNMSSIFVFGFGAGFILHYYARTQDKKDAQRVRLRQNILSLINLIKNDNGNSEINNKSKKLTPEEEKAVDLYTNQKWKLLKKLLKQHDESITLFFVRLSMYRKLHQYETVLGLIREKLDDIKKNENDSIYKSHEHFFHLHFALNESERFNHLGSWKNRQNIFKHLDIAYNLNPDCLLTCATYSLRLASEINKDSNSEDENQEYKDKSLKLIWHAMKLYENPEHPRPVSLVTGMTVPVTYKFLLDTYGYVLLKNGMLRFSKALILQCIFEDPSFSSSYLHLAEWYIAYYQDTNKTNISRGKNESWKKAAMLNLYIAVEIENRDDVERRGSLISNHANKLLSSLS